MKYIIDIPDEYENDYISMSPLLGKEFCYPLRNMNKTYVIPTGLRIEPYTEPSQKAIDLQHAHDIENVARMNYSKGAEDAWEFAKEVRLEEFIDEEGRLHGYISGFNSYSEAKAKYEEWKKQKDEVHVGDEVKPKIKGGFSEKGVVLRLYQPKQYKPLADVLWRDETVDIKVVVEKLVRTGRHFDEIEELLKKMGGEEQ